MTPEWIASQLALSILEIVINIVWLYKHINTWLIFKVNARCGGIFSISHCLSHVLPGICLLVSGTLTFFVEKNFRTVYLTILETYFLSISIFNNMLHVFVIMISDFEIACGVHPSKDESLFYVIVIWISTILCSFLCYFVTLPFVLIKIMCVVFIFSCLLIILTYAFVLRRTVKSIRKELERSEDCENSNGSGVQPLERLNFFGVLHCFTFIIFTIPFTVERFVCNENQFISFASVMMNYMSQALLSIVEISIFQRSLYCNLKTSVNTSMEFFSQTCV